MLKWIKNHKSDIIVGLIGVAIGYWMLQIMAAESRNSIEFTSAMHQMCVKKFGEGFEWRSNSVGTDMCVNPKTGEGKYL